MNEHTTQATLFDEPTAPAISPRAMARESDPDTSHEAAQHVTASGAAAHQRQRVLALVRAQPGLTSDELAVAAGMLRQVPARRLPELERLGLVRRGQVRPSRVTGRNGLTWWPIHTQTKE
jgi:hypothetical protein